MKSLSVLVIILSLCLLENVNGRSTVRVRNNLRDSGGDKTMSVHCRSKNDDKGTRHLKIGETYEFSFKGNIWGTTLYWCNLRQGHRHVSFEAYKGKAFNKNKGIFGWVAREDGIYYTKNMQVPLIHKAHWAN